MVMYVGLVLLSCLGIAAAGEEPLSPNQFQPQWHHGHTTTTVCIQVRGPHGPELCGPMVPPPGSKDHLEMTDSRNAEVAENPSGLMQQDQFRSAQGGWVGPQPNTAPLRSAVLQGFIGNGPVYQMEPGRAVETLPPLVRVNPYQQPQMALVRAPEHHPQQQGPCLEHGMRLAGSPRQVLMAPPPEMAPPPFLSPAPQLRTFPFAPFGVEQQSGPPQPFQMRQSSVGLRSSNPSFVPAVRSADCLDNVQQSGGGGPSMRSSSSSFESAQQQQDVKVLTKQCEDQEQEIKKKTEQIGELKKQIERMSAKSSSLTTVEQKSSEQSVDKDVKVGDDKQFSSSSKSILDFTEKKKKK